MAQLAGKGSNGRFALIALGIGATGAILRMGLSLAGAVPFNADEAVVGLMARHILEGARPLFFYGQAYMGSLDALLVAASFALLGPSVLGIRIVQSVLALCMVVSTAYLGRQAIGSDLGGWIAAALTAIPSVNLLLYTTVSLGGYGEALLIGNLLLLTTWRMLNRPGRLWAFLWGLLAGLGFWAFGLTLIYSVPCGLALLLKGCRDRRPKLLRDLGLALGGAVLGAAPWLYAAWQQGPGPFVHELLGAAISGASPSSWPAALVSHLANLVLFGPTVVMGLRPPWSVSPLAMPLLPMVTMLWIFVLAYAVVALRQRWPPYSIQRLVAYVSGALLLGFVLTPFGGDPSGRYFVPLGVALALYAADFAVHGDLPPWLRWSAPVLFLMFHLWGTLQSAAQNPPGLTTQFDSVSWIDHRADQALIDFLLQEGETRGYTNYWVAYPLAFLSEERIVFAPHLPYHQDFRYTARDDRYRPYAESVRASQRVAYITTNHPALDAKLRQGFARLGIQWQEARIGDYQIFYRLSRPVAPEELPVTIRGD